MRVLVTLAGWAKSETLNRGAPGRTNSPESALEVTGPRVSNRSGCSLHRTYIPTTGLATGCIDSGHAEEAPLILGGFPFAISTMALTELVGIRMELKYPWMYEYIYAIVETEDDKLAEGIAVAEATILARVDELALDHGGAPEEQVSLAVALSELNKLRIERLGCY